MRKSEGKFDMICPTIRYGWLIEIIDFMEESHIFTDF